MSKIPAVSLKHITVTYDTQPVVKDITAVIPQGVICAVVGPNGAGKTTLVKALLGLVAKQAGTVELLGQKLQNVRDVIAYVPQRNSVDWDFPVSVLDVVLMGSYRALGWFRRPGVEEYDRAYQVLERVKLRHYADRAISQLSGGERQRVFLARALMQDADLYIMDEPFIGVDAVTERTIVTILKQLRDAGKTMVIVHHDLQTMQEYFDWMLLLNRSLVAVGSIDEVFTKENIEQAYGLLPYLFRMPSFSPGGTL